MVALDLKIEEMNFTDVGAIVYYATVIPWEFPDFDVKKVMPQLHQLQKIIDSQDSVTTFEDRFIVLAKKN
ncbi:MAG: methyltransferase [Lacticaseibacillus paracasei]|nr:methyltransferase [Lacticaseibacillus paracasei]MBX4166782.1 methyltransferase [Lacticaseibacillus paracasei]